MSVVLLCIAIEQLVKFYSSLKVYKLKDITGFEKHKNIFIYIEMQYSGHYYVHSIAVPNQTILKMLDLIISTGTKVQACSKY